jgi:hypothetical protein
MAYTTIDNPVEYFSATLYTGNGTARTIATGHQSDWVWLKRRDGAAGHRIADSVRGATKLLYSDSTTSEQTDAKSITGFVSTGFTLGDDANGYDVNTNTNTMVAWSWKAGTSFSNDASATGVGSIDSAGSVNTTAGFSITSYTGTGSAATVAHGLGAVPQVYILKNRSSSAGWTSYFEPLGNTKFLQLDTTGAAGTATEAFNNTSPTSSVFSIGTDTSTNNNTDNFIAYCFAEKKGYSKFGSYTGNGNADGTFIYTGFRPAWVMFKRTSGTAPWNMFDNKRAEFNVIQKGLLADSSNAEFTGTNRCDFLSNGIKLRASAAAPNVSGETYIYLAFAESPFVNSNGVPNNAR